VSGVIQDANPEIDRVTVIVEVSEKRVSYWRWSRMHGIEMHKRGIIGQIIHIHVHLFGKSS
jgi:hypothetical protein